MSNFVFSYGLYIGIKHTARSHQSKHPLIQKSSNPNSINIVRFNNPQYTKFSS